MKSLALVAAVLAVALCSADTALIRLTSYPTVTVADGRSTVTISAEVRTRDGRFVPDGTQVVFTTDLGTFRDNVVRTVNGVARAILVAGGLPGTAKITARTLAFQNASTTLEMDFLSDRSQLSTAKEYIEIVAPRHLMYSTDLKIIGAADPDERVAVRYRDIVIEAADVQVDVPNYEVRARKAHLHIGDVDQEFEELYLKLNTRKGYGVTTLPRRDLKIVGSGKWFRFEAGEEHLRVGTAKIATSGLTPMSSTDALPYGAFTFQDLTTSQTLIAAKKAVAFPRKEIQFHKADIVMGGIRMMSLPLFQVSVYGTTPLITEQIVNVNDNQLGINYPHYLSLKPGETSLLRFTTGQRYGRGLATSGGAFLDYELNWNRGDEMDGGMTVSGIGRSDWGLGVRQYLQVDDRTTGFAQVEFPAHRSVFGSASLSRQFDGFQMSLSGNATTTLRGAEFATEQYALVAEKDPTKVGKLPIRLYYGLTATHSETHASLLDHSQTGVGARIRSQLLPQHLDRTTELNAEFSVSHLTGNNVQQGLTLYGSATISKRLSSAAWLATTYRYAEDGFNSFYTGRHQISLQGSYYGGRTNLSLSANRSLDIQRLSLEADMGYRLSDLWRLRYSYTYDRYLGDTYLDYYISLGYRIGFREIGLVWSKRTNRLGIQLLGASFD
ncbi:MAG: Ig-like domain-containing protein [Fimbriimonadaceae bacterium]|nr:Ig-like domain-containing protein [Fimbriimonadaceae bacterium]